MSPRGQAWRPQLAGAGLVFLLNILLRQFGNGGHFEHLVIWTHNISDVLDEYEIFSRWTFIDKTLWVKHNFTHAINQGSICKS